MHVHGNAARNGCQARCRKCQNRVLLKYAQSSSHNGSHPDDVASSLLEHHRNHHRPLDQAADGEGCPRGIKGNNKIGENAPNSIHNFGAVRDSYDATPSDRPYGSGWPADRIVELIKSLSGTHLNSRVVDIFLRTVVPDPSAYEYFR